MTFVVSVSISLLFQEIIVYQSESTCGIFALNIPCIRTGTVPTFYCFSVYMHYSEYRHRTQCKGNNMFYCGCLVTGLKWTCCGGKACLHFDSYRVSYSVQKYGWLKVTPTHTGTGKSLKQEISPLNYKYHIIVKYQTGVERRQILLKSGGAASTTPIPTTWCVQLRE